MPSIGRRFAVVVALALVPVLAQPAATAGITTTVDVGAARLETLTWGEGEPVILLPGSGYSAIAFNLQPSRLAEETVRFLRQYPLGIGR